MTTEGASKRGNRYSWCEHLILVRVIAPAISVVIDTYKPQSRAQLYKHMREHFGMRATYDTFNEWLKSLGIEIQKSAKFVVPGALTQSLDVPEHLPDEHLPQGVTEVTQVRRPTNRPQQRVTRPPVPGQAPVPIMEVMTDDGIRRNVISG